MNLIETIKNHISLDRRSRYRDRRAHYASSALTCKRDQYRSLKGEPASNPTDFVGKMRMLLGNAVEMELIKSVFSDLHWYGLHLVGTQVQVGGTAKNGIGATFDGALDALVAEKLPEGGYRKYVIEIKTKSGYGADLLYQSFEPSQEYIAQLGLYLRDLDSKGVTNEGCLFYVLLSDNHFGKMLQLDAHYDREAGTIVFTKGTCSDGTVREINFSKKLSEIDANWQALEEAIRADVMPKGDYVYKYPLTEELLESQSDNKLRAMIRGETVLGDWQPKYSAYKDKNLAVDGEILGYTAEELKILKAHYLKRHPKSKI